MTRIDYKELMARKSEEELRVYLTSSVRYTNEAVSAAVAEMELRGLAITSEERKQIEDGLTQKALNTPPTSFYEKQKIFQTDDPAAPLLYTKMAIWLFSALVNGLFGAVLMAMNIRKNKLQGFYPVLVIGLGLSIAVYIVLLSIPRTSGLILGMNAIVGGVLTGPIWNKYIGRETMHRPRKVWTPLVIAIVINICMFSLVLMS